MLFWLSSKVSEVVDKTPLPPIFRQVGRIPKFLPPLPLLSPCLIILWLRLWKTSPAIHLRAFVGVCVSHLPPQLACIIITLTN